MAGLAGTAAHAATQGSSDPPPAAAATGTPSDATATVSPTTVAGAAAHADADAAFGPDTSDLDVSLGTSIAHGSFGTGQDSRIISSALGMRYSIGTFRISASVPYLNIRSRGLIFSGIDGTPIIAAAVKPGAPRRTQDGIGDLTVGLAYTVPENDGLPEIELSGRVKLPTASNDQLSTGHTDYSFGVQVTKSFGRFAPFASATYRLFGQTPLVGLKDGVVASAGTSFVLGRRAVVLLSYHYAEAATRLVPDSHELFAGLSSTLPHSRLRLTAFVTAGLSHGAAASSGGLSGSIRF